MFTGIIQEIGEIVSARRVGGGVLLTVSAPASGKELKVNDSVSVNGVCQTVIRGAGSTFVVEAVEETLRKTTLGELLPGSFVNIELPLRLSDRLGGHLVQGHVDCVGTIGTIEKRESSWLITVDFPGDFTKYVIPVGSIAVDGISLTVARTAGSRLTVSIIPHTLEKTTLSRAAVGMKVNLEFDLVGKYIEKIVAGGEKPSSGLTADRLRSWGYDI
jgi:riboflavin synthase